MTGRCNSPSPSSKQVPYRLFGDALPSAGAIRAGLGGDLLRKPRRRTLNRRPRSVGELPSSSATPIRLFLPTFLNAEVLVVGLVCTWRWLVGSFVRNSAIYDDCWGAVARGKNQIRRVRESKPRFIADPKGHQHAHYYECGALMEERPHEKQERYCRRAQKG